MTSLKNKIVLITGASAGIGEGCAVHMASLGCRLSLIARNVAALESVSEKCKQAGSPDVYMASHDLAEEQECITAINETVQHFGELDVLINSAGILMSGSTISMPMTDFDRVMNLNARSAFILTKECLPHILKTKGNIIHISSVAGLRAFQGATAYSMSKAAVDHLVRTSALEVAKDGVRVNAVNPGVTATEIFKRAGMSEEVNANFLEHAKTKIAMGRLGTVDEIAKTVSFLASDDASFITGQTIAIDGGKSIMCPE